MNRITHNEWAASQSVNSKVKPVFLSMHYNKKNLIFGNTHFLGYCITS